MFLPFSNDDTNHIDGHLEHYGVLSTSYSMNDGQLSSHEILERVPLSLPVLKTSHVPARSLMTIQITRPCNLSAIVRDGL